MKKLLSGDCHIDNIFNQVDPTSFTEIEFEVDVVKAMTCLYSSYWCGSFSGSFTLENEIRKADLALLHVSLSHWFVVEVELANHSLEYHVQPQVRCFRFGEPSSDCSTSLLNAFDHLSLDQAKMILNYVPRHTAVISNIFDPQWAAALSALNTQYLSLSIYRDHVGRTAYELDGTLSATKESLGFAQYTEILNCLKLSPTCGLGLGKVQIVDQFGSLGMWTVYENEDGFWLKKDHGPTFITHEAYVQIIKTFDGRVSLRVPTQKL